MGTTDLIVFKICQVGLFEKGLLKNVLTKYYKYLIIERRREITRRPFTSIRIVPIRRADPRIATVGRLTLATDVLLAEDC